MGNAAWTVVLVQAFWYRWYVNSKQKLLFCVVCVYRVVRKEGGAVLVLLCVPLHIESIYECGVCVVSMFPAHHLYACIIKHHHRGTCSVCHMWVVVVDWKTVQKQCFYNMVRKHVVVGILRIGTKLRSFEFDQIKNKVVARIFCCCRWCLVFFLCSCACISLCMWVRISGACVQFILFFL